RSAARAGTRRLGETGRGGHAEASAGGGPQGGERSPMARARPVPLRGAAPRGRGPRPDRVVLVSTGRQRAPGHAEPATARRPGPPGGRAEGGGVDVGR